MGLVDCWWQESTSCFSHAAAHAPHRYPPWTQLLVAATGEWRIYQKVAGASAVRDTITAGLTTAGPMAVPAVVYAIQNTLYVAAAYYLPAAVQQAGQNLKILMAGVFATLLLSRPPSRLQWASLAGLLGGVTLITTGNQEGGASGAVSWAAMVPGLVMVVLASTCSGFAGAWTEMHMKKQHVGIWMRNVQLAAGGATVAFISAAAGSGRSIAERGVLAGFNRWAWLGMALNALGGFLVAFLLKVAPSGSVLKNMAPAAGLILTLVISAKAFGAIPTAGQVLGCAVIAGSLYLYNRGGRKDAAPALKVSTGVAANGREQALPVHVKA